MSEINSAEVLNIGCGITAWSEKDAVYLFEEFTNRSKSNRSIASIHEIISLDELDRKHVLPNIDNPELRGIWFPMGLR
jgi:hypothetical protein